MAENSPPILADIFSVQPSNEHADELIVVAQGLNREQVPFSISRTAARKLVEMLAPHLTEQ